MKENDFRKALCSAWVRDHGSRLYIQKNHGSAYSAGLPDLQLCIHGRWASVELKASDTTPLKHPVTALQRATLQSITKAGGRGVVVALLGPRVNVYTPDTLWMLDEGFGRSVVGCEWANFRKHEVVRTRLLMDVLGQ